MKEYFLVLFLIPQFLSLQISLPDNLDIDVNLLNTIKNKVNTRQLRVDKNNFETS